MLQVITDQIVALLVAEREKINRALEALGATVGKRRGRPPGLKNGRPEADALAEPTTTPAKTARKGPTSHRNSVKRLGSG
jgi:hypothetical protein